MSAFTRKEATGSSGFHPQAPNPSNNSGSSLKKICCVLYQNKELSGVEHFQLLVHNGRRGPRLVGKSVFRKLRNLTHV